jgi:hypothetical protein
MFHLTSVFFDGAVFDESDVSLLFKAHQSAAETGIGIL